MSSDGAQRAVPRRSIVLGARRRLFGRATYWLGVVGMLLLGKVMYDDGYASIFLGGMPEYPGAGFTPAAVLCSTCIGLMLACLVTAFLMQRAELRAEQREKNQTAS